MKDFTEQEVSVTSPPVSSPDTPIVSDSHPGTDPQELVDRVKEYYEYRDALADPETTEATKVALEPYTPAYFQDETEPEVITH